MGSWSRGVEAGYVRGSSEGLVASGTSGGYVASWSSETIRAGQTGSGVDVVDRILFSEFTFKYIRKEIDLTPSV